jgi:sulfur-carrier protein adenylyltransferase/sulfurtransferase
LIGTAQACEAIKLLAGIGEPLSGKLLLWDALTMRTQTVGLAVDPRSREIRELPAEGYGETCEVPQEPQELREEIDVDELRAALASGQPPQIVDVREDWEREIGIISPDVHVPLSQVMREGVTGINPAAATVVYCAAGARSLHAARALRERFGFRSVVSLRGGMKVWLQSASGQTKVSSNR